MMRLQQQQQPVPSNDENNREIEKLLRLPRKEQRVAVTTTTTTTTARVPQNGQIVGEYIDADTGTTTTTRQITSTQRVWSLSGDNVEVVAVKQANRLPVWRRRITAVYLDSAVASAAAAAAVGCSKCSKCQLSQLRASRIQAKIWPQRQYKVPN